MRLIGDARLALVRLHRSGSRPVRMLLIGDRAHLAPRTEAASLARRAVDRVWLTTRRGVDADVLCDAVPALQRLAADGARWRLWRYDAVVVLVGGDAGRRQRERVLQGVQALLAADAEHGTPVVLLMPPPPNARHGDDAEHRLLRDAAVAGGDSLLTAELPRDGDPDGLERRRSAAVGEQVALALGRGGAGTDEQEDEAERQRALDESGALRRKGDPRLGDLVELARVAFGAQSAEINFIDRDRQWKAAVAGGDPADNPRAHSFCSETIKRPDPLVVGDTRLHPVLRRSPMAMGPRAVRFYAAHPIESLDGYRIGSFCVYDSEPRDVRGLDLAVLRDLALLAQAELIAQDTAPVGATVHLPGA